MDRSGKEGKYEIIQYMYDMVNNEEAYIEYVAFFAGANMVLDFISGRGCCKCK